MYSQGLCFFEDHRTGSGGEILTFTNKFQCTLLITALKIYIARTAARYINDYPIRLGHFSRLRPQPLSRNEIRSRLPETR